MDFTPRKYFNFKAKYCSILKRTKVKDGSNERFSQNRHQSKRTYECLSSSQALVNTHSRLTETTSFINHKRAHNMNGVNRIDLLMSWGREFD